MAVMNVQGGMSIYDVDGEPLGLVGRLDDGFFICERGGFFVTDVAIPYSTVIEVTEESAVLLSVHRSALVVEPLPTAP